MNKRQKIEHDRRTLKNYEKQLRNRRKEYGQIATAFSVTGRRNRTCAIGECVLKLMEALHDLRFRKNLLSGSLFWGIDETRVKDQDGKKGFEYKVWWRVKSDEPYYTDEEIKAELEKTYEKMRKETEEMFGEELSPEDEPAGDTFPDDDPAEERPEEPTREQAPEPFPEETP